MNKTQKAVQEIAKELFSYNVKDRIKTVDEYCILTGCSRGIVQRALKQLEESNAVSLMARGQIGTFIASINYLKLLQLSEIKHVLGSMPLPYTRLYEGLASSIIATLQKYVRTSFAYTRGALNRLERTEEKIYDFAIVSEQAIKSYLSQKKNSNLRAVKNFGNGSYVEKHTIIYNKNCFEKNEITVGVDDSSEDHKELIKNLVKQPSFANKKVKYYSINSYKIFKLIDSNTIDITVWNTRDNLISGLSNNNISFKDMDYNDSFSKAVLVVHKDNTMLVSMLSRLINEKEVISYQKQVVEGKVIPQY